MTEPKRIAVGDKVRLTWASPREGYAGEVVEIHDGVYFVRLLDDRWANLPPVAARQNELRPEPE